MKKILLILVLIASLMMPSKAVLKGYNLDQTISMLNSELEVFDHRVDSISDLFALTCARFNTQFDKMKLQSTTWLDQYSVNYERSMKL